MRIAPMPRTLAFLHTSHVLIPAFAQLAKDLLPGFEVFHMVDESLIKNTIRAGELTKSTRRRVVSMIGLAHDGGAEAVMLTCSSIGPSVENARAVYDFPIFRIDEAMAEKAVGMAAKVGVAATLRTTLEPTLALLQHTADQAGRKVELVPRLSDGAFQAVLAGQTEQHDAMVKAMLQELMQEVDVVVLAQASMARVVPQLDTSKTPVLTSPELAVHRVRERLMAATFA
jgi:Asp/Glu/hydantoin racemase